MSAHTKVLANEVAKRVGLPATWPNVNTIAAAIELEAWRLKVAAEDAAEVLVQCAFETSCYPQFHCPSEWEKREISRENNIDRFWFEDARWTVKAAYTNFRAELDRKRGQGIFGLEVA